MNMMLRTLLAPTDAEREDEHDVAHSAGVEARAVGQLTVVVRVEHSAIRRVLVTVAGPLDVLHDAAVLTQTDVNGAIAGRQNDVILHCVKRKTNCY